MKVSFVSILVLLHFNNATAGFFRKWRNSATSSRSSNSTTNNSTGPPHDHGFDGPGGRGGGRGGGGPRAPPGVTFVNDTCAADTSTDSPCLVGPPSNQTSGSWVCRTLYDIVTGTSDTFSACVGLTEFITTDVCGCCDNACPSTDPCTTTCNITAPPEGGSRYLKRGGPRDGFNGTSTFNTTGVLVSINGESRCVPAELSVKLVTGPGFFGRATCA